MNIYVFGNPNVEMDSLPIRLLPALRKAFPDMTFTVKDPNEEWDAQMSNILVLDTAVGIDKVTVFHGLDQFAAAPRLGMHDFDALTDLRYMEKLGKIRKATVIGVPAGMNERVALAAVNSAMSDIRIKKARHE